jgi:glycosyltransferase involved in cell wall biosynthesis
MTGRRPSVLMVTARYPPQRGGTEVHASQLARRLTDAGWAVTVACSELGSGEPPASPDPAIRVIRVPVWLANRDWYFAPGVLRLVRGLAPDIVHCHGYHTFFSPLGMLGARLAGIPYVVTLHSGGHSSIVRRALRPLQTWLLRPLFKRAERIIAVSKFEAGLFSRRLRLPEDKFAVIPGGVELPAAAAPQDAERPPEVVSLGRLEAYKGHKRVIAAMPKLAETRPDLRLRILGSGGDESALRRTALRLGVADAVEIAGVPAEARESLASVLERAGVVVALSDYESQGLAVQEALALGRPALVSDGTALAELKRHANVLALPKNADSGRVAAAIDELLARRPAMRPILPTWSECATAVAAVYEQALAESGVDR